jgi:hypothetical protein
MSFASQTIPTTSNATPIQSYTPEPQSPNFGGQINVVTTITNFAGTNQTLTAAQILGGFIIGSPTGAANYTTDTAANIINAIEGAVVGSTIKVTIRNKSAGANTITLVAGTGVTLNSGDTVTVVQNAQKTFKFIVTGLGSSAAVTVYSDALTF